MTALAARTSGSRPARAVLYPAELPGGRGPEHQTVPQPVSEGNWFFRLSRYAGPLREAITSGRRRVTPAPGR